MPSVNLPIDPAGGPILTAMVLPSAQRLQALHAAKQPIPTPQNGRFLVDTGASGTVVDPILIAALALTPKNFTPVATPTTGPPVPGQPLPLRPVYDVQLILLPSATPRSAQLGPSGMMPHMRALSVIGTHMRHQGIDGLIGRDVLENVVFVYNGHTASYTLAW